MPRRRFTRPEDDELDVPPPTAQPIELPRQRQDEEDDRLVPDSNVGGAAPTPLGLDSGGDLPGTDDDLSNLAEPEPPEPPEVEAVHVRRDVGDRRGPERKR